MKNTEIKCGCCKNGYIEGRDAFGKTIKIKCQYCDNKGNILL